MNAFLYAAVVVLWGTTWLAIAVQSRYLPPVSAAFWRFAVAAVVMWGALLLARRLPRLSWRDQGWCALQGACVFCLNFVCLYTAVETVSSGLLAVIFSLAVCFNALNARIFFRKPLTWHFALAAALGLSGMVVLFAPDMAVRDGHGLWRGIGFAIVGTYLFSLGNMISVRHQQRGLNVFATNACALLYGVILLATLAPAFAETIMPPLAPAFWLATLYLAIPGTVIGFAAYFALVGRIGAANAAYSMLLTPLVALAMSVAWEGYAWHAGTIAGVTLILLGNVLMFKPWSR